MGQTRYPCSNQQCQNTFHYEPQCPNLGMARPMVRSTPTAPPSSARGAEVKHSDLSEIFSEANGFRDGEEQGWSTTVNKGERLVMVFRPNPNYPDAAGKVGKQGPDSMFTRLNSVGGSASSVERLPGNECFVYRTDPAPEDDCRVVPMEAVGAIYDEAGIEYDEDSGDGEFLRHETYIERAPQKGDYVTMNSGDNIGAQGRINGESVSDGHQEMYDVRWEVSRERPLGTKGSVSKKDYAEVFDRTISW